MKKILVLFVLALGLASFANNCPMVENLSEICDENFLTLKGGNDYNTEVLFQRGTCTATVTYNGEIVRVFSVPFVDEAFAGMACQLAVAQACDYIQSQGGTCPR